MIFGTAQFKDGTIKCQKKYEHNQLDQLKKLAGENCWFGSGSRVMITTRDKHLLVSHEVKEIYEAEVLNHEEALQLFSLKALKMDHPPKDFGKLSQAFVNYSKGLPLALEVLGSFLFKKNIDEWKNGLDRLNEFPERRILDVLQISLKMVLHYLKMVPLNVRKNTSTTKRGKGTVQSILANLIKLRKDKFG